MTHQEIEKQEIIERYVRHKLAPEERRAFQEHYFACEECFDKVQVMTQFVGGVRQAARQGVLAESEKNVASWWAFLFRPAFGFAAALLLLAATFGWRLYRRTNTPTAEIAFQAIASPTVAPMATGSATPQPAASAAAAPTKKLVEQPDLLAQNRPPVEVVGRIPAVLLEATRGASGINQLTLAENTAQFNMRIEADPMSDYTGYQFQIFDSSRRLIAAAASGKASKRGTIAATLPAAALQNGKYLVKCFGLKAGQRELVGEYDLQVRKP